MHCFPATTLCTTFEEEVSSQYGSSSFSVNIIDETDSSVRTGQATLLGSSSYDLVTCDEYVYVTDFLREDNTAGSVDIVSLTFSVNKPVTVTFYLVNSINEELFPSGVSSIITFSVRFIIVEINYT